MRTKEKLLTVLLLMSFALSTRGGDRPVTSPQIKQRMVISEAINTRHQASHDRLMEEMRRVTNLAKRNPTVKACVEPIVPDLLKALNNWNSAEYQLGKTTSCTNASPDSCWLKYFDKFDRLYEKNLAESDVFAQQLAQCSDTQDD